MDETRYTPGPGVGHETSDVNIWAIGKFGIALVAVCVISIVLLFGLMKFFQMQEETSVANTVNPLKEFPSPQLQQTPVVDLKTIRAEENQILDSYAWVDQKKGVVRIPIDQAIEILAKRGLPARAQSGVQAGDGDVSVPTASGEGIKPSPEGQGK